MLKKNILYIIIIVYKKFYYFAIYFDIYFLFCFDFWTIFELHAANFKF